MRFVQLWLEQRIIFALSFCLAITVMTACSSETTSSNHIQEHVNDINADQAELLETEVENHYNAVEQDGRVFYEIFVRSYYDSNGDGIGDLNGVTAKLDYLVDLGVGGIWLMPIFESSTYHGYDTNDYYQINEEYGTKEDLARLVEEAHKRDIKVIIDLVLNHTGYHNPWFQEALAQADSPYRSWYQFLPVDAVTRSDSAAGTVAWHKTLDGKEKYLGIFDSQMPDLNFDNEEVVNEMIKVGQYWLKEANIDGYRLDAAKHIFGDYKSNIYEQVNIDKNVDFWQKFRAGMEEIKTNTYLIGEVWDSTTYISYFLDDALDGSFNFDLAESIIGAVKEERDADFGYVLQKTYRLYQGKVKGRPYIDAPFLTNHDQERIMSIVNGNIDKAKMAASILLTLPGNPYIYYGEEIGMMANKPDENIREPMLWYMNEAGGEGQTTWKAAVHNLGDRHVSVEQQEQDTESLLNHYKTLIELRNQNDVLKNGDMFEYSMSTRNTKISTYVRATSEESVLVVHNLSSLPQIATFDEDNEFGNFEEVIFSTNPFVIDKGRALIPPYTTLIMK